MEQFYLEIPSIKRKKEAIEYIKEHHTYNSYINGTGGLYNHLDNYEEWLIYLENIKDKEYAYSVNRCPGETFFLIRYNDNKIIGMVNIRHDLTEELKLFGGHIGYGIRPTERRKGYNKINLYLGLIKAYENFNIDEAILDCTVDNLGSNKTIKALGGILKKCEIDPYDNELTNVYTIDVLKSIQDNYDKYKEYIHKK